MIALKEDFLKLLEVLVEQEVEKERDDFAAGYLAGQQHLAELILETKGDINEV